MHRIVHCTSKELNTIDPGMVTLITTPCIKIRRVTHGYPSLGYLHISISRDILTDLEEKRVGQLKTTEMHTRKHVHANSKRFRKVKCTFHYKIV